MSVPQKGTRIFHGARLCCKLLLGIIAGHMCLDHVKRVVAVMRLWMLKKHASQKTIVAPPIKDSPTEADFRLEEPELTARKAQILANGLPVNISVQWLKGKDLTNPLLALVVTPLPGFVHLVKKEYITYLTETFGEYHISIVFKQDISPMNFSGEKNARIQAAMEAVFARWNGVYGTIPVDKISRKCTAAIGGDILRDMNLLMLHDTGSYEGRELHVSM